MAEGACQNFAEVRVLNHGNYLELHQPKSVTPFGGRAPVCLNLAIASFVAPAADLMENVFMNFTMRSQALLTMTSCHLRLE